MELEALPPTPFTRAQAEACGVSRWRLAELQRQGSVRQPLRGVYQRADLPDDQVSRAQAACLVIKPFVVVGNRFASWIHGVDAFRFHELEIFPPLEVFALPDATRVRRTGCRGRRRDLCPDDITTIEGVRVTTPLRTLMDLACERPRWEALATFDAFIRDTGITQAMVQEQLPRFRGRRGVRQLRALLPLADGSSESTGESMTRLAIIDAKLPVPELQVWVPDEDGIPVFRLDLAYPRHRVAVEYDGLAYHQSAAQRAHDERRRQWLREQGWTIIVVTKDMLSAPARHLWLAELRDALSSAAVR